MSRGIAICCFHQEKQVCEDLMMPDFPASLYVFLGHQAVDGLTGGASFFIWQPHSAKFTEKTRNCEWQRQFFN
jgi:hypothetical protein